MGGVNVGKAGKWSPDEDAFLLECLEDGMADDQISSEFHRKTKYEQKEGFHRRTVGAIKQRRKLLEQASPNVTFPVLKVKDKPVNHHRRWTLEDDIMLQHYESMGFSKDAMASLLNRTESSVENRLTFLARKPDSVLDKVKVLWSRVTGSKKRHNNDRGSRD